MGSSSDFATNSVILKRCRSKSLASSGGCLLPTFLFWERLSLERGLARKIAQCLGRGKWEMERKERDAFGRDDLEEGKRLGQGRQTSGKLVQVEASAPCSNSLCAHRGRR